MKAAQKKPKTSKPPSTDAEALADIVVWSADRPAWTRDALRLLLNTDELDGPQLEALYQSALSSAEPSAPIADTDVRSAKFSSVEVTLKAVIKPEDVNALASDQSLSFEKSGLTIVYGDNGAGKSGYARILKYACRARIGPRTQSILPNIDTQAPGTPRAKIAFVANTQNKQTDWQLDRPSPPELSAVSVFDTRTATVHVDGVNEVAYVPFSLDLMQRLAKTGEAIRDKARTAKLALEAQTPQALRNPPIDSQTDLAKAIAQLSAASDLRALEAAALLTAEELSLLADLKRDLTGDPAATARQLLEVQAGLSRFADTIRKLCEAAGRSSHEALARDYALSAATRAAADAAARNRFATEPLTLVGSDAWRALWEAARRYSTAEARPGLPFPPAARDEHCPLCQQPLSDEALDRFSLFEAFVRDDTKRQADAAAKTYSDRLEAARTAMPAMSTMHRQNSYLRDTLRDDAAYQILRRTTVNARWHLRKILRMHTDQGKLVADIDYSPALAALQDISQRLAGRASALTADAHSPERIRLLTQLKALEAREWLKSMLPDVAAEVSRKKKIAQIDRVIGEADTRAITQKASQLAELLVTDALRAQFIREIAALGVGHLAVELKKEASQVGAARFRVRLVRKPSAAVGTVLSEGEHRCVALAAFLAELATSGGKSAIIFDDPVSSLDHRHRSEVAARLATEARSRQVIVLTHDVAFLMLLNNAAQEAQAHVGYRCIARGTEFAGFCSHEPPFHARPIDDVLDAIEANLANQKIHFERGNQSEWRNTVRGSLEQLRETWERAVEEFVGPVLKRLANKVSTSHLIKLTCLDVADCDAMRDGYGRCSELLHSVAEALNPKLPTPDDLRAEIERLHQWHNDLRTRQAKIKAA